MNVSNTVTLLIDPIEIIPIDSAGANVQKGRFLDTPLHAAAQKDCPEIVKVLLEFGANINARNLELQRAVETAPPSSLAECLLLHYEGKSFVLLFSRFLYLVFRII